VSTLNGDKGPKSKNKKSNKHCNYCGQGGHLDSKCFENMETLQETMKTHNINLNSPSSNSFSQGHALSTSSFSFNATSTSNEWIIDSRASYNVVKDKAIFLLLMNVTPNKYLMVMIDILVL